MNQLKVEFENKFKNGESFFINGKLTDNNVRIVGHIAQKCGYKDYVVLYLDDFEADDIAGIPINNKNKAEIALPTYANELMNMKGKKPLLMLDFTGAKPDVMNALMPVILQHEIAGKKIEDLTVVGFGDYNKLASPLQKRFGSPINAK